MRSVENVSTPELRSPGFSYDAIGHLALAARDFDHAIVLFRDVLGFTLTERREIRGKNAGMISAEMEHNGLRFVLCQGTEENSQVSNLVSNYGPGVAHMALAVDDVRETAAILQERRLEFDTGVIEGPGLAQIFTLRCQKTGLCFEFIKREPYTAGFVESNVQQFFDELERKGAF